MTSTNPVQRSLSVIPTPYVICHIARLASDELDPDTGNPIIKMLPPVLRAAQGISQIGRLRGSSEFQYSTEFVERIKTDLHVSVADPSTYAPFDQVLLFPEVDEVGEYVVGSGMAFYVDGVSYEGRTSPWPLFTKCLGGMVRVRRVT